MHKRLAFAAAAAVTLFATPILAQTTKADPATPPSTTANPPSTAATPPADDPATSDPAPAPSASTPSASSAGADVSVTTGMSVKDNTGATIGSVSEVKTAADGKKTATIKMGADTFAVDTSALAIAGGAATVNASQAEIKGMLKKK